MTNVDVVVPCYNYGRFLRQCVDSILSQDGVGVRVLVIDDASSDDTAEVGAELSQDPRVSFQRHEVNRGHIATYNEGLLGWASAEYCALVSADDMLAPGALARAGRLFEEHPDAGLVYGMAIAISGDTDQPPSCSTDSSEYALISGRRFLEHCFKHGNPVPTPSAVVRTRLQHQVGGYRPDLPHAGDMEMWMRIAVHAPVGVHRDVQAYYRWHGNNMSLKPDHRTVGDRRQRLQACREVTHRYRTSLPEMGLWLQALCQQLSQEAFWEASRLFDRGQELESRAWLHFAEEAWPDVRHSTEWQRFRLKKLIGPRIWSRIRKPLDRVRGLSTHPVARQRTEQQVADLNVIGWWPERWDPLGG